MTIGKALDTETKYFALGNSAETEDQFPVRFPTPYNQNLVVRGHFSAQELAPCEPMSNNKFLH